MPHVSRSVAYDWLRHDKKFPHVWCPGCGLGILLGSLVRSFVKIGLNKDQVVLVSGIGCSGRLPVYVDVNSVHTTHGRALTYATGLKLAKPELKVITIMGDGDAMAIGGNHLIHAARRNLDIVAIIVNNQTYGMTGGQYSPATPLGAKATTALFGQIEPAFDVSALCAAAGAPFVARSTVFHVDQMDRLLTKSITNPDFSVLEILSPCYTNFGRLNRQASHIEMMRQYRQMGVAVERWNKMNEDERAGRFPLGILVEKDLPKYLNSYQQVCDTAGKLRAENKI